LDYKKFNTGGLEEILSIDIGNVHAAAGGTDVKVFICPARYGVIVRNRTGHKILWKTGLS
jgi:hypothetical protein